MTLRRDHAEIEWIGLAKEASRSLASGGETVLVTDRDRVVAELVPPRAGHSALLSDARLADAVRKGWLTPALVHDGSVPPRAPILPVAALLAELCGDRDAR